MDISVIIPTYKPQDYLWECLNSLKTQTLDKSRFEVIIVLNGCYEPYYTQIKTYIASQMSDMNVQFIHTDIPGVSNARNIALNISMSDYITFIDDDDYISPMYLEELFANSSPETIALSYPLAFNDGSDKYKPYRISKVYNKLSVLKKCKYLKARKYFSGPVYKLIHRSIIGDRRFDINFSNNEDAIFMFLISDKFQNVSFTSKNAIYYRRIRENSAVTRYRPFTEIILHTIKVIKAYIFIYCNKCKKYSFSFFMTRILGTIKGTMITLLKANLRKKRKDGN